MSDLAEQIRAKVAAVDEIDARYDYTRAGDAMGQMRDAILAALDVHKPQSANVAAKPHLQDCAVCLDVGPERCDHVGYPCDTVLAIAKGLGIEVDDGE